MQLFQKFIIIFALAAMAGCSSSQFNSSSQNAGPFEVSLASDHKEVQVGEPFKLVLTARNRSAVPVEFWSLSCGPGINWSIDNSAIHRMDVPLDCERNTPIMVSLLPGDEFQDVALVSLMPETAGDSARVRIGFAPWQSKEQLLGWVQKTIELEEAKNTIVWSDPLSLEIGTRPWPYSGSRF